MQQPNTINLTLVEIYTLLGIVGLLLGAATLYLRLSLTAALSKNKEEIIQGIKLEFVTKEVASLQYRELSRRVDKVEGRRRAPDDE